MSASRTPAPGSSLLSAPSASAAFEYVAEFSFKGVQAGVEQFPLRHDHDIEPGSELVATEYLANEPLGPVPHDGAAKLPGRRNTETACFESVGQTEQRERTTVDLDAAVVNILVLGSFPDTLGTAEARLGHESDFSTYSLLTVNRFRPLARRRLRTRRPFLVAMRTRKPCALRRRRVFGWNVRLPFKTLS
jgi:hypothetical protein